MTNQDPWDEISKALTELGYTLKKELSVNRSVSKPQVWLSEYQKDGVTEQRALKISSSVIIGGKDNKPEKLDELAQREIDITSRLDHANIPKFRDSHKLTVMGFVNVDVLASEYIDMENLQARVERREKITDEKQAGKLLEGVLSALDHVHNITDPVSK